MDRNAAMNQYLCRGRTGSLTRPDARGTWAGPARSLSRGDKKAQRERPSPYSYSSLVAIHPYVRTYGELRGPLLVVEAAGVLESA
ncbi:hypothetical protein UVI_02028510 [Ustilaginoidea virens]|uniref:Uncharacterized protein n=1 Tax=Ustilaginoidea virens TaxID=1159556 RepID=A0A1B5KUR6_USTVR|nr:hypothetical protein UVI_02028510 [Ustilaginoidea virens]